MKDVREIRNTLLSAYRDATHRTDSRGFYSDVYPPEFVGTAQARYIKTIGETEITWNPNRIRTKVNAARIGDVNLEPGDIEIVGELAVTSSFGDGKEETYVFSRSGLLKVIANGYSHSLRTEVEDAGGRVADRGDREYWPYILHHFLRHGNFDIIAERSDRFRRIRDLPYDSIERANWEEAQDAAKLLKEVFDNSRSYKSLVPLSSMRPFSKAVARRLQVEGRDMRILYVPSEGGVTQRKKISGTIYLLTTQLQTVPLPAVINAGYKEDCYVDFPLREAAMIRTDRQPKIASRTDRLELQAKELEMYIGKVGEAEFASEGRDILNNLIRSRTTYGALALTIGLPLIMRVARLGRVRFLPLALLLTGIGLGAYSVYRCVRNASKRVVGDEYIYFLARGKELTGE